MGGQGGITGMHAHGAPHDGMWSSKCSDGRPGSKRITWGAFSGCDALTATRFVIGHHATARLLPPCSCAVSIQHEEMRFMYIGRMKRAKPRQ